ncbi:class I SAM-dependent methyltransferase [Micromonospora sp. KC207]|uniref:class I SAM-dependent methyltransferase n=1 Tax=Micromonospora sp. KC207 TaxID=2530377 RepID=UPI00104F8C66|nr:class I SAM-dependent methyltransferase [Micromonospora sp. KC207]TDC48174.1 class I SAM-dependent methyltransferase [Micromonospora sp. KC207]
MSDGDDSDAFASWLRLREPADAAARAADLLAPVRRRLAGDGPVVIHDLGAGTGSMGRWLAPRLSGPQHWVLYDRDPGLLERARAAMAGLATEGGGDVTVETRRADITRLSAADLADASLVTASALLDMLTAEEVERIVAVCAARPCLFTLSVVGRVELTPTDPLDAEVAAAFDDHQRRVAAGRGALLGPDAVAACLAAFARHGVDVRTRPSPWRLGPDRAELTAEWFTGWLGAAREQRPELTTRTTEYGRVRRAAARAGRLGVLVDHCDLLTGCG